MLVVLRATLRIILRTIITYVKRLFFVLLSVIKLLVIPCVYSLTRLYKWLGRVCMRTPLRHLRTPIKKTHHHIAKRPHNHLMLHAAWYRYLHEKNYHHYVNGALALLFVLGFGSFIFSTSTRTYASLISSAWNFSNPAQYTYDDAIEIVNGVARLKPQSYTADANTMALYHLDEASGSNATDASGATHDGTITQGSFGVGTLNNALTFNGTGSLVSTPDSAASSLGQTHSIEAWTKLGSSISAGSSNKRQTVIDKGDYSLYYDNDTGKVTYEVANGAANSWSRAAGNGVNGSWDIDGKLAAASTVYVGGKLYAGLGNGTGDAEVWRWNGTAWDMIGGDGINGSWDDLLMEYVYAIETDGTNIYAGLGSGTGDAEVWRWNGTAWTKIAGDGINAGWAGGAFEMVYALEYFDNNLYAALGNTANDAEVWRFNGTTWTKIGGDSLNSGWTTNYETVSALQGSGSTLYAGLGSSAGDGEVWSWNGAAWTKLGGDALNGSMAADIENVRSIAVNGSTLYVGTGDTAGDGDVWRYSSNTWTQIGGDAVNSSWAAATYEYVSALEYVGGTLYAGLGSSNADGEVWSWNGTTWTKIGGDGINGLAATEDIVFSLTGVSATNIYAATYDSAGSGAVYQWDGTTWTRIGGQYINSSWGFYGMNSAEMLHSAHGYLYAGTGAAAGNAQVWRFNGTSWQMIGGQGINNSWPANTYETIHSITHYGSTLVVGLGTTANDAEVWSWNGTTWTKIGGDSINSGWTTNYEGVTSLVSYGNTLYAGLGSTANDAEVWSWNGTTWTKIGGDSINSGWTTNYERVSTLGIYNGLLYAGLGDTAGDGELWRWSGSAWTKVGGDGLNGSWDATIEYVESFASFNGKMYIGLGASVGDAELWMGDGTTWTKIGGDDVNDSWTDGTYENVRTISGYNGKLYVGLGSSTGDGEVWQLSDGVWTKIGGSSVNNGWSNAIEDVLSTAVYQGKMYAGTGTTANTDAAVWAWSNSGFLQSTTDSFDTEWRHLAATYDGTTMKLFINGQLNASKTIALQVPDSARPLLLGTGYGGINSGDAQPYFQGSLDEVRLSNIARTEFTTKAYSTAATTLRLKDPTLTSGIASFADFQAVENAHGGSIRYRVSIDNGVTWLHWNGTSWHASATTNDANTKQDIALHIASLPLSFHGIVWQAVFKGDGSQQVSLSSVDVSAESDSTAPTANASALTAKKSASGDTIANNAWTNSASPYFSWTAAADAGAGIAGYCLYLGTDNTADLVTTKGLLGNSPVYAGNHCQFLTSQTSLDLSTPGYLSTALTTSTSPYYLLVRAIDKAGNFYPTSAQFQFRFDNTPPTNPSYITAPSGFINTKATTLTWPTTGSQSADDSGSGLAGLQYRINNSLWYGDSHTGNGDSNDTLANDGSYATLPTPDFDNLSEGINTVYFRTWDVAGNISTGTVNAILKINTAGAPSEPQDLTALPATSSTNAFAFSWNQPATFIGDSNKLVYCYTVNVTPNASNCNYTAAGIETLGSSAYATQPGANTLYLVAKDESGNINYASHASVTFTTNTPAPGVPTNTDIVDVSIKTTSNWRTAITWDSPPNAGNGVASYRVFRSANNVNFTQVGNSSSTTYIDAGLQQKTYYYKIAACDNTNNCGATGTTVSIFPTGKFTSPADLIGEPTSSDITTKKATITWSTDRNSDSKIAIGTTSGQYGASEVGNSNQVKLHTIKLDNLAAGTTYYYVAKWTDEDGNTGTSQEFTFTTSPAPVIKEIEVSGISLTSGTIKFTSKGAYQVKLYYGQSDGFGGLKTINTSAAESQYTFNLDGLSDGAKYYYRLSSFDNEGSEYMGNTLSFTTPPRPKISNLRFQPVEGQPTSTQIVSWTTNVPSTSMITYGKVGTTGTDLQLSEFKTAHEMRISNLDDDSQYFIVAQGRDVDGNVAISDRQQFRTALDTRAPTISDISVESSIRGTGAEARGQVVISWKTDEPSTSQVAYAEGSSAVVFNSKTAQDSELTTEHLVIVSDLPTSRVYSMQPISLDKANNAATGEVQSAIIGRASESVLTVILNTMQRIFGL